MITHKSVEERQNLKEQMPTFKCEICLFVTKYKGNLKNHRITHKSPEELQKFQEQMPSFKCYLCAHVTKQKSNLRKDMVTHKSVEERKKLEEIKSLEDQQFKNIDISI